MGATAEPSMKPHDPQLQLTISALIQRIWQHYQKGNASAHNELLADDYTAVFPDGSLHLRRPTREEILASPMTGFSLTKLQVAQLTGEAALANYVADVDGPSGGSLVHLRWQVGEIWVKRNGEWKCRYYQPTLLPSPAASPPASSGHLA